MIKAITETFNKGMTQPSCADAASSQALQSSEHESVMKYISHRLGYCKSFSLPQWPPQHPLVSGAHRRSQ